MGSMNYAKYSRARKDFVFKMVFENRSTTIIELLEAMNELGIKPEHECFDIGHVGNLDPLIDMGVLRDAAARSRLRDGRHRRHPRRPRATSPHMAENIPGGPDGPERLGRDRHLARPVDAGRRRARRSAATSASASRTTSTCPTATMARSNGDLIAKARQMTEDVGRRPATVAEARAMLGTPARGAAGRSGRA